MSGLDVEGVKAVYYNFINSHGWSFRVDDVDWSIGVINLSAVWDDNIEDGSMTYATRGNYTFGDGVSTWLKHGGEESLQLYVYKAYSPTDIELVKIIHRD